MISVVVPLFNYVRYIEDNIKSISSQNTEWELIIVDDCSTDDPYSVIKPHLNKKIRYIRLDKNVGYGSAKNVGIKESTGEYIVVLDADDILTKGSLKTRMSSLINKGKLWCHGKVYEFSGDKPPYNFRFHSRKYMERFLKMQKTGNYKDLWRSIHAQTVMVHRSVYEKVGLYEPKLRSMGDKEMWARICNNIEYPLYVNSFVANYRMHSEQMHRSKHKKKNLKKYESIMKKCISSRKKSLKGVVAL